MKIIIVTNTFPAPSETFISNKVLILSQRKHEVIVFCNSFKKNEWDKINGSKNEIVIEKINQKTLFSFFIKKPGLWLSYIKKRKQQTAVVDNRLLLALTKKHNADIIHFEFSGIGIKYLDVLKKINSIKVVSCRGSGEKVKLLTDNIRKQKMKQLLINVDLIHCVSDDMKQTILPYCNDVEKIFINYPSIDATIFKRTLEYTDSKAFTILSIGRLTFQKGYLSGLLAVKNLRKKIENFKWIIVGDGSQHEEILFHINEMNLNAHVELVGLKNRSDILSFYNTCDLFFLPSVYEGIANVALEAMSMQLPIVATRSGGMEEVITHNIDGMLADVYDSETMAKNLEILLNDFPKRKQLGIAARDVVLKKFTLKINIDLYEKVYSDSLINSSL